jgi:uncharacterized protein YbaR (Trm112 family)
MKNAVCPSCKKTVRLAERMKVQELIICPNCKANLELVKKIPLTLDWSEDPSVYSSRRTFSNLY